MQNDPSPQKQTQRPEINQENNNTFEIEKTNQLIFQFTSQNLPRVIAKKVVNLVNILNSDVISIPRLKQCLAEGIPDQAAILREYSWKLILGYLPPEKAKWEQTVKREETTYRGFIEMFLPVQKFEGYPLILKKNHPKYKQLEDDYLLWEQIEKDTSRTHAQFSFFATESRQIMVPYLTSARREKFKLINGQDQKDYQQFLNNKEMQRKTYRYDYMTRILYIYSRLNPRIQYVQGMNEILAPIFYLVNIKKPTTIIEEASCFLMFNNAISDIIELHIKDLDKSQNGIYGRLNQVNQMLIVIEPMLWNKLEKLKIDPFFYSFRWVTLLYAQDFALFDILRIWESVFSSQDRFKFICFIAIAIIMSCKEVINNEQFTAVLEYLQNIKQNINADQVINIASQLYLQFKDKDFKKHAKKTKKALEKQENDKKSEDEDEEREGKRGFFKKVSNFVNEYF